MQTLVATNVSTIARMKISHLITEQHFVLVQGLHTSHFTLL